MNLTANHQVLHHRGNYLVRRQRLAPGEATPWHHDPFHRVTVVLSGDLLNEEVVTFFLVHPEAVPQPKADSN